MKSPGVKIPPHITRLSPFAVRFLTFPIAVWCALGFILLLGFHQSQWMNTVSDWRPWTTPRVQRIPGIRKNPPLPPRVSCYGARGRLLDDSPEDDIVSTNINISYPVPFQGSHRDMGVDLTWLTADDRYGPYGYGEDYDDYNRTLVDWDSVDWGELQDNCMARNAHRFPNKDKIPATSKLSENPRFKFIRDSRINPKPSWNEFTDTRRTAIVVRAYDGFDYKEEDMWFLRSLITEAGLKTGGEYTVILLVNVQDSRANIFRSQENYDEAFLEADIPQELQSIAVLWDDNLLESWYAAVPEHRTMWQVFQPLQLFALHYPEFDHFWQIELDQRFFGDAGRYLDAMAKFARDSPRKQSLERATFSFSEEVSGSYEKFAHAVDVANNGGSISWGPMRIPDIEPIGPEPPFPDAEQDAFEWGVGEEADAIVTGFCADPRTTDWLFKDYIQGFMNGTDTPRFWCPPAIQRSSRTILLTIHEAQYDKGMSIPSEAVLPSFAMWHGLKMVSVPHPVYMHDYDPNSEFPDETVRDRTEWRHKDRKPWFGWEPGESADGMGHPEPMSFADRGLTWWWTSNYPRHIMDVWLWDDVDAWDMPSMLAVHNDRVYAPNFAMHPVKT